jgi:hypothetical protein
MDTFKFSTLRTIMNETDNNMKQVEELKNKIKSIQNSLLLMSFGDQEDRPLLYANLKRSLTKAKKHLMILQLTELENNHE